MTLSIKLVKENKLNNMKTKEKMCLCAFIPYFPRGPFGPSGPFGLAVNIGRVPDEVASPVCGPGVRGPRG